MGTWLGLAAMDVWCSATSSESRDEYAMDDFGFGGGLGLEHFSTSVRGRGTRAQSDAQEGQDSGVMVVKVSATMRYPDLTHPWTKHSPQQASGTGVVIDGKRILTNAHVVALC